MYEHSRQHLRRHDTMGLSRRGLMTGTASFIALAAVWRKATSGSHQNGAVGLPDQPDTATPAAFIAVAFEQKRLAQAAGDQSYGAIIVRDQMIVGVGPSRVVINQDPTAHAETEAIRDAARRLGTRDLSGCTMYSSSPPCPMCESAAYWARIERLYHGSSITDGGAPQLGGC